MKLTTVDLAHLAKLKKNVAAQRRWRWPLFLTGLLSAAAAIAGFIFAVEEVATTRATQAAMFFAVAMPMLFAVSASAGACMGMAIKNWNGDPVKCLLIRLLESQKNEDRA
jgi:uncharacterized membrane protein HdeD (DUF308 family)